MAVKVQPPEAYKESLRKLFPRGPYWDNQFKDPDSDCNLFCEAKAVMLVRLRERMSDLQRESFIQAAEETIEDWERVLLGRANLGLDTTRKRALLNVSKAGAINIEAIKEIGRLYGITINDVAFPFRPAFFGHSCFGADPIASPAAFSVLFVYASQPDENIREEFERHMASRVLSNFIVNFVYGGD